MWAPRATRDARHAFETKPPPNCLNFGILSVEREKKGVSGAGIAGAYLFPDTGRVLGGNAKHAPRWRCRSSAFGTPRSTPSCGAVSGICPTRTRAKAGSAACMRSGSRIWQVPTDLVQVGRPRPQARPFRPEHVPWLSALRPGPFWRFGRTSENGFFRFMSDRTDLQRLRAACLLRYFFRNPQS